MTAPRWNRWISIDEDLPKSGQVPVRVEPNDVTQAGYSGLALPVIEDVDVYIGPIHGWRQYGHTVTHWRQCLSPELEP